MPGIEPILIRCDKCSARIAIHGSSILGHGNKPKTGRVPESGDSDVRLYENTCPKCREPFEVWQLGNGTVTHVTDLQHDRPEIFIGKAGERVEELARQRTERAEQQAEAQKRREQMKLERAERDAQIAENQRFEREQQIAARRAVVQNASDDGDWEDDGGGRSPNDDRSDSMNPNNDAYQAAMDNHADQMNPNNDAYQSSRGR